MVLARARITLRFPSRFLLVAAMNPCPCGLFGGEGFIMQKLEGDGLAFVHAGGTIIERELGPGETLRVDTGCIVAFTPGITYDIARAGNLKSMFFGGEGLFLATLSGHGTVLLQSLPFSRLADRVLAVIPGSAVTQVDRSINRIGSRDLTGHPWPRRPLYRARTSSSSADPRRPFSTPRCPTAR